MGCAERRDSKKARFFENAQEGRATFMVQLLGSKKLDELREREGLDQNFMIRNYIIEIQRKRGLYLLLFCSLFPKIEEPDETKMIVGFDYC